MGRKRKNNLPPRTTVFPIMVEQELSEGLKGIDRDTVRAALLKVVLNHGRPLSNILVNYYFGK